MQSGEMLLGETQSGEMQLSRKYGLPQPLNIPERPWKPMKIDFLCGLLGSKNILFIW